MRRTEAVTFFQSRLNFFPVGLGSSLGRSQSAVIRGNLRDTDFARLRIKTRFQAFKRLLSEVHFMLHIFISKYFNLEFAHLLSILVEMLMKSRTANNASIVRWKCVARPKRAREMQAAKKALILFLLRKHLTKDEDRNTGLFIYLQIPWFFLLSFSRCNSIRRPIKLSTRLRSFR